MPQSSRKVRKRRRAVVLFTVLFVVVLLSLAAYQYAEMMMGEYRSADSYRRSIQAHAFADSGIQYAAVMLSNSDAFTNTLNGNAIDNPTNFQAYLVHANDQARWQGRFSIVAPLGPDEASSNNQATTRPSATESSTNRPRST
jgi:Tfp pilus assembly protein PilX